MQASAWRRKARFVGAACIAGNARCNSSKWSTGRKLSASRPTWRIRCSIRLLQRSRGPASARRISIGDDELLFEALETVASRLRPWTIDFHVAQNDATVKGSGSHDKTGRHCLPDDPNGKLDIVRDAGLWLRNNQGQLTVPCNICWDGCMFPNRVMLKRNLERFCATMICRTRGAWLVRRCGKRSRCALDLSAMGSWAAPIRMPIARSIIFRRRLQPVLKAVCGRNSTSWQTSRAVGLSIGRNRLAFDGRAQ